MTTEPYSPAEQRAGRSKPGLKFAIMCTGPVFPAWQARCINFIIEQGLAQPVLLIVDDSKPASVSLFKRLRSPRLVWNMFYRFFVRRRARSIQPVDLAPVLKDVPPIHCAVRKGKGSGQYFDERDLATIREHRPDFILRFGFNIIRGEILSVAPYGVWSFHHDDLDAYRGPPACFWPGYCGDTVQGVTLQKLTDGIDCGVVLKRCWLKYVHYSYARNLDNAFFHAADMPAQVCRDIIKGHTADILAAPSATNAPIRTVPRRMQTARFALRAGAAAVGNSLGSRLYDYQWGLGLVERPVQSLLEDHTIEPRWILPMPRGRFLADPFIARADGKLLILAEDYTNRAGRGHISAIVVDAANGASEPVPVIQEPHHLSYPYLVERRGELFCIPESAQAGEIAIYAPQKLLQPWRRSGTLLSGIRALDSTIVQFEDRWWMFVCTCAGYTETRLEIFHAADLFGPWQPHARNPVKSDIRSSRPAGTPFVHAGILYRPAQDCSHTYGGSVVVNRVERLNPDEFCETPAFRLQPAAGWRYPHGMHTLSWTSGCMVIDAKRRVLLPRAASSWFPLGGAGRAA